MAFKYTIQYKDPITGEWYSVFSALAWDQRVMVREPHVRMVGTDVETGESFARVLKERHDR